MALAFQVPAPCRARVRSPPRSSAAARCLWAELGWRRSGGAGWIGAGLLSNRRRRSGAAPSRGTTYCNQRRRAGDCRCRATGRVQPARRAPSRAEGFRKAPSARVAKSDRRQASHLHRRWVRRRRLCARASRAASLRSAQPRVLSVRSGGGIHLDAATMCDSDALPIAAAARRQLRTGVVHPARVFSTPRGQHALELFTARRCTGSGSIEFP